jgi:hypothetical protein
MATADQNASEGIGRAIDGKIFRLQDERRTLLAAAVRIAEIDAELLVLQAEKARIDPRRPRPATGGTVVDVPAPNRVR